MARLHLYNEPAADALGVEEIADYLRSRLGGAEVNVRQAFHEELAPPPEDGGAAWVAELAYEWAGAKVLDPMRPVGDREPLFGEIAYEKRRLSGPAAHSAGIVYDGPRLQLALAERLPAGERGLGDVHLVFTRQLIATFSDDDLRYHVNVLVGGMPNLLSSTGLVEGPAKPREHYVQQAVSRTFGRHWSDELAAATEVDCRWLLPEDPRTTEVMKGYALQAVFHQLGGETFCEDRHCRLFNARWQEEVLAAQLCEPELCPRHEAMLAVIA